MKTKPILGAILSGCLLSLSFPRFNLEVLAWVALVPLLLSIHRQGVRSSFYLGALCGVVHYLGTVYWIAYTITRYGKLNWGVSIGLLLLLVLYLGLYVGAFAGLLSWCSRVEGWYLLGPFLWVALEYLRSYLFTGFPWALLGYSQYLSLPVIQLADVTGVYGISFLILLVNCSIAGIIVLLIRHRPEDKRVFILSSLRIGLAAFSILLICLAYGWWRMAHYAALDQRSASLKVAVVQGNIEQDKKWDPAYQEETMRIYKELTQRAAQAGPQLIVWPESATPFFFQSNDKYRPQLLEWAQSWESWLLFGSPSYQVTLSRPRLYNSAFLISPRKKIAGVYHKIHLVPFGEYVPLKHILSFAGKLVAQVGDFSSGGKYTILQLPQGKLGVVICYEIIFPQLVRRFFDRGAQFLVNITNDAWFGQTSAPLQHFSMLSLRAVENRSYIVRAANTGISGFVDPVGRIQRSTPIFVADYLVDTIHLGKTKSFYAEYGDIFSWLCIIVAGGWLFKAGRRQRA
jgi:apolipoprotein N-acyltransferase